VVLGRVEQNGRVKAARQSQRDRAAALFASGDLAALAQMWMEGQPVEWEALYGSQKIVKLALPTYPFAKERHWVSDTPVPNKDVALTEPAVAKLHPLVCNNVSTLREVRFASTLSARQYYGRDHQVGNEMFFPGAGFLEIACASGTIAGEEAVTRIEDIVWNQPLRLTGGEHRVQTFLKSNGGAAEFVVVSYDDEQETVVHSEGRVFYGAGGRRAEQRQSYSIPELTAKAERTVPGADCYRQLAAFGLNYGPCFQTIEQMHVGQGFVLSRLALAQELMESFEQYILHPCLIDGALQSVIGIATGGEEHTPYLPFALDEVAILRPLRETCYAYVEAAASNGAGGDIKQFNIAILSESGEVLVRLNNFYVRALRTARPVRNASADSLLLSE
jgi:polyketide synthase PksL